MKKIACIVAAFIVLSAGAVNTTPVVNEKVLKTFDMLFEKAENVTWRTTDINNEACFNLKDIKVRAVIDNNGQLIRTIRYYGEEHLPANIRYSLKKKFEKKEIRNVSELSSNDEVTYYVTLMDEKHLVNAVVNSAGQVIQSKRYTRADR
ncbi:hypothetical protein LQ567_01030 [Niabella pedocola]|uniref:Beta-lactamase-inhibitor-like PepSY-like domain-containing protein n=1 Tax=Niabella pedocola TaxID=1752077 RepID=A0ABS8PNH2_9BACT|nr:hypothetical protein [Niabella pedocola]MCD2421326.1 hypothetical protein [Niabella pedocola]